MTCYADHRDWIQEARDITIPTSQLIAIGDKAVENIPLAHNRKRRDGRIQAIANAIEENVQSGEAYCVGDVIAFRTQENAGTKKWTDIYCPVKVAKIEKLSDKTVLVGGHRVSYGYILGRIEDDKEREL